MIGETLGSYRIVGRLGAGGMGEVYLAEHARIDRRAAIKVLLPELSHNQEVVDRFFAEARATSSIHHPGIVEVLDCDIHPSGRAYIVMELLEGESLAARLAREPGFGRNVDRVLAIGSEVADAIAAAHAKGIVHRDLKPDNIFLVTAPRAAVGFTAKILDFGIAKLIGDGDGNRGSSMRTRTGSLLGTPAYMSPEQCRGASRVDHRTDIYSFGCIAYEMLAGQRPFTYEGFGELISAHMTETPKTMAQLGIKVPPAVEDWLRRLLAKSPADRFSSMNEVAAAIEALRTGAPMPAPATRVPASATGTAVLPAQGDRPGQGPTPSVIPTAVLPAVRTTATTTLSENAAERLQPTEHRRRAPRWPLIAGAAAVLVLGIGGVALLRPHRAPAPAATPPETAAEKTAPATTAAAPTPAIPTPVAPPPPEPRTVTVEVDDAPAGLTLTLDGATAELPARLPAGDQVHELTFRAPGHRARTLHLDGSQSRHVTLALEPAAASRTTTDPAKPAPPRDHASDRRKRAPAAPGPADLSDDARKL
jgi:serine/threonine protein kinase